MEECFNNNSQLSQNLKFTQLFCSKSSTEIMMLSQRNYTIDSVNDLAVNWVKGKNVGNLEKRASFIGLKLSSLSFFFTSRIVTRCRYHKILRPFSPSKNTESIILKTIN